MVFNRKEILAKKERNEAYGHLSILIFFLFFFAFAENYFFFEFCFYLYLTIGVISIYAVFKNDYNNIKRFVIFLFLLVVIFPLTHDVLFRFTNGNYAFNEDYLNHRKREISKVLLDYNDTNELILIANTLPSNILNLKYDDKLIGKRYTYKKGSVLIAPELINSDLRDRDRRPYYKIEFFDLKSVKKATLKINNESIIAGIYRKINERKALEKELKKPEDNIHFSDIWLDSITVFIFSNIKPISRFTQVIQLLQVLTTFIYLYMLTSFLDNFKILKITKKYDRN